MIRVMFGILLLVAVALYFIWRRKAKPVLRAEDALDDLRTKKEALKVQELVLNEQARVAELEKALAEKSANSADVK